MTKRGWCPSVYEPMPTGDGLLVRVKPRGGVLTASAARRLAEAASRDGNGVLELTSRAGLQIRGLGAEGVVPFAQAMVTAGLAHADADAERRRNVIATALADVDPAAHPSTAMVTAALEAALEEAAELGLPPKFSFVVDGGGVVPASATAEVRLHLLADRAEIACGDHAFSALVGEAVAQALRAAERYRDAGGNQARGRDPGAAPIGALDYAPGAYAFGVGLPFGSTDASTLRRLAALAEAHGDGRLRLTPWRAVLIAGVRRADLSVLHHALGELGLITDKLDPRARVAACPGQPACASASVPTRALASRLRPAPGATIHVSGCEKGCAHPGPAATTLVGRAGRFDLVRGGRAGDAATRTGLTLEEALAL